MKAFYFSKANKRTIENDSPITVGGTHTVTDEPKAFGKGLHGNIDVLEALLYAPSPILYLVRITGNTKSKGKHRSGKSRKYLEEFDVSDILHAHARQEATNNINDLSDYATTSQLNTINRFLSTGIKSRALAAHNAAIEIGKSEVWRARQREDIRDDWSSYLSVFAATHATQLFPAQSTNATLLASRDRVATNTTLTEMIESATGWDLEFSKNQNN